MNDNPAELAVKLPADVVEAIAQRAAAIALGELRDGLEEQPYLTVEHAAVYIDAKPQRVRDLLSQRRLTGYKDGRRTLVSRAELDAHLNSMPTGPIAQRLPTRPPRRSPSGLAA